MASADGVEIERKFDVDEGTQLPTLEELPGVGRVGEPVEYELDAVYFDAVHLDSGNLALAARRITLRRRTGGEDAGWHLKTLLESDARQELHEPLGDDPEVVPERFMRLVRVHVRDRSLVPVVHLQTRRIMRRLLDAHGAVLAEVCDDRVQAERLGPAPSSQRWREWEVELVDGGLALLDAAQSMLATVDAQPATHVSKLARALGDWAPRERPPVPAPNRKSTAGRVLLAYLDEQVQLLWKQDPRVREGEPDSVQQMRIATRRLRSALTTYRPLVDADLADCLRRELKWLGGVLGAARDLQVLRERLSDLIAAEPPELVLGPISRRIDEQVGADFDAAHLTALRALEGGRYFRLLDSLDHLLAPMPLTELASEAASGIVPDLVRAEWKRLRNAVRAAEKTSGGATRDLALHEVRKSAKRLRYAAEAATPVHHKPALRLVAAAENLQTILGGHQDSVVSRGWLRRGEAAARLQGESGFSYGRLDAIEQYVAADSDARFVRAWSSFPGPSLRK